MKKVQWIKCPVDTGAAAVNFRKAFCINKEVKKATAKLSSMGNYAAFFNSVRLGEGVLTPGYTSMKKRVQYFTYDITSLLKEANLIEHTVAPGWAVGHMGYDSDDKQFHDNIAAICEIEILYADGTAEYINTDESWEAYTTPVTMSDIYMGEWWDNTLIPEKIGNAVFDNDIPAKVIPQVGEDIIENERIAPIKLIVTPKGERVVDFGQNMAGYVEFNVKGKKGDIIEATCAEILDADGNFYNANYRSADSRMKFILDGEKTCHKPLYTFFGFRYIRIENYPDGEIDLNSIRAIAVHSRMKRLGYFSCGNEKINQLYHNTIWGQKSNYLDVPTDCPQRNERLGWTGDAQVFCRTAALNFDVRKFFKKWLGDMRLEQGNRGEIMGTVPETCKSNNHSLISAAWGDCSVIAPWQLYEIYGDESFLSENYEMMEKWVEFIHSQGSEEHLWLGGWHYGDWLGMDMNADECDGATSTDFIASAFYVYDLKLLIKAGEILGKDVEKYRVLYEKAFCRFREYFMEDGLPSKKTCLREKAAQYKNPLLDEGMTQTAIALILHFGLYLPHEREKLADKLCKLIDLCDGRMTTGFVGTPYLLHALSNNGKLDVAYKLLFNEGTPSWLYSVNHGATTMWEHWNGLKEDGSFWNDSMNSFNHYAYGSVFDWIYANVGGIDTKEAGFKKIKLAPKPNKKLGFVNCRLNTVAGEIESNWYYKDDGVFFEFSVPENTTAEIILPDGKTETVASGNYRYFCNM